MKEKRNAYRVLLGKPEERKPLENTKHAKKNIKINFKQVK
jgi:hypothetical protein